MAIDISGLQEYVKLYPELLGRLTMRDSILSLFNVHEGEDPGRTLIRIYEPGTTLGECCADSESNASIDEKEINSVCIAERQTFCETDLAAILRDGTIRYTAGRENAGSMEEIITNQQLASLQKTLDILVFQGDTDSTNPNLNKIDGLIKQAQEAADSTKLDITTGNLYQALQQIILSTNIDAFDYGRGLAVFVPQEVYNALSVALIGMNLYHYTPQNADLEDNFRPVRLPGFPNVDIIGARGLNGTNTIIATPLDNIHWLTSLKEDHMTMSWIYNDYHERYKYYVKFILGLTFGIDEYVTIATIDPAVIAAPFGMPISIVSPINATTGGVITTEAAADTPGGAPVTPMSSTLQNYQATRQQLKENAVDKKKPGRKPTVKASDIVEENAE